MSYRPLPLPPCAAQPASARLTQRAPLAGTAGRLPCAADRAPGAQLRGTGGRRTGRRRPPRRGDLASPSALRRLRDEVLHGQRGPYSNQSCWLSVAAHDRRARRRSRRAEACPQAAQAGTCASGTRTSQLSRWCMLTSMRSRISLAGRDLAGPRTDDLVRSRKGLNLPAWLVLSKLSTAPARERACRGPRYARASSHPPPPPACAPRREFAVGRVPAGAGPGPITTGPAGRSLSCRRGPRPGRAGRHARVGLRRGGAAISCR